MAKDKTIFKSAFLVTVMMIFFKFIGFIKQAVIAYYFGATLTTDIYFIAFDFISGLVAAITKALSVAIIGVYTLKLIKEGRNSASSLISELYEILFPIMLLIIAVIWVSSPFISKVLAPTYNSENIQILSIYLKLLSGMFVFAVIEVVNTSILDAEKNFYVPRFQAFIYSAGIILCCVFLRGIFGIQTLLIGQYVACFLYAILIYIAGKKYYKFKIVNPFRNKNTKHILKVSIPLILGNSVLYINAIVDKIIASGIGDGIVSSLAYCHVLEDFVVNVIIVNICNILFAHFTTYVADDNKNEIVKLINNAIIILVSFLIPISVVTVTCSQNIVSIVYLRGSFSPEMVEYVAIALVGYALAFPFVAIREIVVKGLYAFGDTISPMKNSVICVCINIVCSIVLSRSYGIFGIALGTCIATVIGVVLNIKSLKKHLSIFNISEIMKPLIINGIAAVFELSAVLIIKKYLPQNDLLLFVLITMLCVIIHGIILGVLNKKTVIDLVNKMRSR